MSTGALLSLNEYLKSTYSPDREYIDGVLLERHLGEKPHSKVQRKLIRMLTGPSFESWPEQRVQVKPTRFRVPDVCVTIGEPDEDVFTSPPFICIEILSPEDSLSDLQERIDDYLDFGVGHVWLIDPRLRRAYVCNRDGLHEFRGGTLATEEPHVAIPLRELFE